MDAEDKALTAIAFIVGILFAFVAGVLFGVHWYDREFGYVTRERFSCASQSGSGSGSSSPAPPLPHPHR